MNKPLDERMKFYEGRHVSQLSPLLPIYLRLDGRSFHSFTKNFDRPYDFKLSTIMQEVTEHLVTEFNADVGYTQSDEISLAWKNDDYMREMEFGGKDYKLLSLLAAECSVKFFQMASGIWPDLVNKKLPIFDCRLVQFPSLIECSNMFRWRVQDAVRNSIQSSAQSVYSHNELMNKSTKECQEMLFTKGINWNDYPTFFKEGTFIRKDYTEIECDNEDCCKTEHIISKRRKYVYLDLPKISSIANFSDVLFNNATPILKDDNS